MSRLPRLGTALAAGLLTLAALAPSLAPSPATAATATSAPDQAAPAAWAQVTAGDDFTCAIGTGKSLWCWGDNDDGELGIDSTVSQDLPARVGLRAGWRRVSAGGNYACAIRDDNTLWCWGYNRFGALGAGSYRNHLGPVQVGAQAVWAQVSAGTNHVCALRTDGTLWCWGLNDGGDLGIASPFTQQSPVQVGTDTDWRQVSAGGSSTCAIRTDQTLWCWGLNIAGLIGVGSTTRAFRAPTQVRPATGWQQVSVSGPGTLAHACAIDTGSSLWCWGANNAGQLGTGGETGQLSPVEVGIQNDWRQVATGDSFTCATRGDPRLWCWGDNSSGQLGIGSTFGPQNSPVPAGPARLWHQVAAGASHACAIRTDRTLWCWGQNSDGELGIASTVNQDSPVQVGQST